MRNSLLVGGLVAALSIGCASTKIVEPPPIVPVVEEIIEEKPVVEDLSEVYQQISVGELKYRMSMDPANADLSDKYREEATDSFSTALDLCIGFTTCNPKIVTTAFDRVVTEQTIKNRDLRSEPQYFDEEEPIFLEPSAVDSEYEGNLEDITGMNGPIKEAIRHWLMNKRSLFVESYINFLFLEEMLTEHYEQADFPVEIAFGMGSQESNFKMQAYSRDGARGLFQIMCRTAKALEIVPGRSNCRELYDPELNIEGSITYLKTAIEKLGDDWLKIVASYSTGYNRDVLQDRDENYWEAEAKFRRRYLNETKNHVRQVAAAMILFDDIRSNADKYNLASSIPEIDPTLVEVVLQHDASLSELSACMGSPPWLTDWKQTLRNINPAYGIEPDKLIHAGTTVLIPQMSLPGYEEHCINSPLWTLLEEERPRFKRHQIASGESYGKIASAYAKQCGMTEGQMVRELRRVNGWSDSQIPVGKWMTIPCGQN